MFNGFSSFYDFFPTVATDVGYIGVYAVAYFTLSGRRNPIIFGVQPSTFCASLRLFTNRCSITIALILCVVAYSRLWYIFLADFDFVVQRESAVYYGVCRFAARGFEHYRSIGLVNSFYAYKILYLCNFQIRDFVFIIFKYFYNNIFLVGNECILQEYTIHDNRESLFFINS